jgi:hypothetical protein
MVEPFGTAVSKVWFAANIILQGQEQNDVHPEFQDRAHRIVLPNLSMPEV